MTTNDLNRQKDFTASLISALATLKETPTRDVVEQKAKGLADFLGYEGDLGPVIEIAMIAIDTRMGAGVSLVDVEAKHDDEWVLKREIPSVYSDAYEAYLKADGWHPTVARSLGDVSNRILGHLQDPLSEGDWNRRGLVIGHVQSGKTANYLGLIARAADAGYKFIIVIAGIHNNLRRQTQERVDEGFIGRSSDPSQNHVPVGVGTLMKDYPNPVTVTTVNDDFRKNSISTARWKITDFRKPVIFVIKKNTTTLEALHRWLKDVNAQGDTRIHDVPMLMIDDEADNASINTNKPDLDPTKTNALLRKILSLFSKRCYVGYTATPFANIFINPDGYDDEIREELFPKDFIYALDAPTTYFGPDKVFLNEASSAEILEEITDAENYLPLTHRREVTVAELPPSLYEAVNEFIVARAIRNFRGQQNKHCSMLINVSRFIPVQRTVRDFLSDYLRRVNDAVRANYAMPEAVSSRNQYMQALRKAFDKQFSNNGASWEDIKPLLNGVFDHLRPYVINSKSDEALDYKRYERDGIGLTAIAIGGLSLSRGLTIEGLTVSYMYRNTAMYDTLMQMGRWFGYRPKYEDLCRVYLSPASIDWYAHIAEASDELRQQIVRMRRDKLSPKEFGLYVLSHPDTLLITAANKMRFAEEVTVRQNFSGTLTETYRLPQDAETNRANEELIREFWGDGFGGLIPETTEKGWMYRDVPVATVENFLRRFQVHSHFMAKRSGVVDYLQLLERVFPVADVLLISVKDNDQDEAARRLGWQLRNAKSEGGAWHTSKDRVASRGDEKHGLSVEQQKAAVESAALEEKKPSDVHYRAQRNKPLLMLHVLKIPSETGDQRVPAFGVSFPEGQYARTVTVVANRVWVDTMQGPADSVEDDEDFDDE